MIRSMIIVEVGECADHLTIITAAKCGNLRLIHTCRSGLRILQCTLSTQG